MLTQWFECKVRYDKTMDDGLIKSTNETYLVDALSFTEAEQRFIEEIEHFVRGEYVVTDIKRAKISELFESNDSLADRWFKARIAIVTIDEKTGTEKRTLQTKMIQATDLRNAVVNLDKCMANSLEDYVIVSVAETKIMDIYRYKVAGDNAKSE